MIGRQIIISGLILTLLAVTAATVGALWTQPETELLSSQQVFALFETQAEKEWLSNLTDQQAAFRERLNTRLAVNPDDHEAQMLKGLFFFQTGRLNAALEELKALIDKAPRFQLAHLIYGDLLLARFDLLDEIGSAPILAELISDDEQRIDQLRKEAKARLQGYLSLLETAGIPRALVSLSQTVEHALIVDKSKNRLYVYQNAGTAVPPKLIDDYYIVLGKQPGNKKQRGDLKTPSGIYFVTGHIADEDLPRKYGSGAFPVNYPNEYDRFLRKTGDGIWLHGTHKDLYSRPPLDSEGCVVLTNDEFTRIGQYVAPGTTPVIISEQVEWISPSDWLDRTIELQAKLENWRQDWERADIGAYLNNYSADFWTNGHDYNSWKTYKKRVLSRKKSQDISLSNLSLFAYPRQSVAGQEMIVANFQQHYRSNNYSGDMAKRLYLVHENGDWRILYEGRQ